MRMVYSRFYRFYTKLLPPREITALWLQCPFRSQKPGYYARILKIPISGEAYNNAIRLVLQKSTYRLAEIMPRLTMFFLQVTVNRPQPIA